MLRLLAVVIVGLMCSATAAQEIRVVTEDWAPYNYMEDGEVRGVVTDIVRAALDHSGLDYDIEVLPWARAYKTARDFPNVMIYSIFRLPSRERDFKWIHVEGFAIEMGLFKPCFRKDIQVRDLEDVKQYMVGVTRDTSTHHFLLEHGFEEQVNLLPLSSERQNILMTQPGVERTDFATGDGLSLARWVSDAGLPPDYLERVLVLFREDIYLAFGRATSDAMVARIANALDEITEMGLVGEIIARNHRLHGGCTLKRQGPPSSSPFSATASPPRMRSDRH